MTNVETLVIRCEGEDGNMYLEEVRLFFEDAIYRSVFGSKNNKTVAQTILHRRYRNLASRATQYYPRDLGMPLGMFLLKLKQGGDTFYKEFLNDCGDLEYCRFCIADEQWRKKRGIYVYTVKKEIRYAGRCLDSFEKRINNGYGRISPKNCFIDGQKTNCHLNNLVLRNRDSLQLYAVEITDAEKIKRLERCMINIFKPPWNIA